MQDISYSELVQALKRVRIWVRDSPECDTAHRMIVLDPEDAARDIFISVRDHQDE